MNDARQSAAESSGFPNVQSVLAGLKPFQRKSVDYVFHRLYGPGHTCRFLLADEVGLGKTLVARGVIARAIEHLRRRVRRIDVVYICSNHDIARQNITRLNVTGRNDVALASRITLLPIQARSAELRSQRVNFVSFTPGTSFDLKSRFGVSAERVLLYHLLLDPWQLKGVAPVYVLRGHMSAEGFRGQVEGFSDEIDPQVRSSFLANLAKDARLHAEYVSLCEHFHRADARITNEMEQRRSKFVGDLRGLLARTCLQSLQPDLIILDEFQRFKHLLAQGDSEEAELAAQLFGYSDEHSRARVLLLSATPYKMYTMSQESAEDDHYSDFLQTTRFLLNDNAKTARLETLLKEYRRQLYRLGNGDLKALDQLRSELEGCLREVMCRTERLAVTADRSGMLREVPAVLRLEPGDVRAYVGLQKIANALDSPDTVEYWKSAPYLLNFMENYRLKGAFTEGCADEKVYQAVQAHDRGVLLPWETIRTYGTVDPQNPRLRELLRGTVDAGAWQLLWIPPSLPYYRPSGPFAEPGVLGFTKRLIFSNWHVVPRAVASLVSYEAERRMVTSFDPKAQNTVEGRKGIRQLLNFARSKDRLTGMPVLGLLYPCFFLAERIDPLRTGGETSAEPPVLDFVLAQTESIVAEALEPLMRAAPETGAEDESWYWAAPLLLDHLHDATATNAWFADEALAESWSGSDEYEHTDAPSPAAEEHEDGGWDLHVRRARELLSGGLQTLGRPPADLARVVAELALAGPAVVALRALGRIAGPTTTCRDHQVRHLAGNIAWGFRTLFNSPQVICLIRGLNGAEPYWRRVLEYCAAGCLQAVLDEYVHLLHDSLGGTTRAVSGDITQAIASALNLRMASPGVDHIMREDETKSLRIKKERWRAKFAMRFGDERSDDGRLVSNKEHVRQAFNSPFWPFVLVTTSIGQEGLDFHTYCHAVVHWNLPANPVDMEQREGRVHRYKGHAVRRNVALLHQASIGPGGQTDPWECLFAAAAAAQQHSGDRTGLTPYWVYTAKDGAVIERHVPALPLSREADCLPALRNSLAVYRMIFGQPRQDDLVAFLRSQFSSSDVERFADQLQIDLSPREVEIAPENGDLSEFESGPELHSSGQSEVGSPDARTNDGNTNENVESDLARATSETDRPIADPPDLREPENPPPIDEIDRNQILATIRELFCSGPRDRDQAIREVAGRIGYQRTGSRIYEVVDLAIQTAVRRGILENSGGQLSLSCRSINQYTLDHLVDMLLAALGGGWSTREDAIVAAARHLGYRRTGQNIHAAIRSAINAAIRRRLLERDGPDRIRRAR